MSVSLKVTNETSSTLYVSDLYVTLDASGDPNDSITVDRSVAQVDSMTELKKLLGDGTVSVEMTAADYHIDFMSVPIEQHGIEEGVNTESTVTFEMPFPDGVKPVITATPEGSADVHIEDVTNEGFKIVTSVEADVHWRASF